MGISNSNPRRGGARIGGSYAEQLNKLDNGLGSLITEINRHLNLINSRIDAQGGYGGTVTIKPQTKHNPSGQKAHSLIVGTDSQPGRVGGVDWAQSDNDAINLEQFRAAFTCENFGPTGRSFFDFLNDCGDNMEQGIMPTIPVPAIVHEFWAHTFHLPNHTDTIISDPGLLDVDTKGTYFAMTVPVTAIIDTAVLSMVGKSGLPGIPDVTPFAVAIYQTDPAVGSASSYPLLVQTVTSTVNLTTGPRILTVALNERVTLLPAQYIVAFFSFCSFWVCNVLDANTFNPGVTAYGLAYMANANATVPLYGAVNLNGSGAGATLPTALTAGNTTKITDETVINPVMPAVWFYDSQKYA